MIQLVLKFRDGHETAFYRRLAPETLQHEGAEFDRIEHAAFMVDEPDGSEGRPRAKFEERAIYQERGGDKAPGLVSTDDLPW